MTRTPDPISNAFAQQIVSNLAAAMGHEMSPEALDCVRQAHEKALALLALFPPPTTSSIDGATFDRLLEIAGPETAPSLLKQVLIDLGSIQRGLTQAAPKQDWKELRHHSHVLISIAGSLGAGLLGGLAEELNSLANRADVAQLEGTAPLLLAELDQLLDFVRSRSASLSSP